MLKVMDSFGWFRSHLSEVVDIIKAAEGEVAVVARRGGKQSDLSPGKHSIENQSNNNNTITLVFFNFQWLKNFDSSFLPSYLYT